MAAFMIENHSDLEMRRIFWILAVVLLFFTSNSVMVRITDRKPKWVLAAERNVQSSYKDANNPSSTSSNQSGDSATESHSSVDTTLDDMNIPRRREPTVFSGKNGIE